MADKRAIEAAVALAEAKTGVRGGKSKLPMMMDAVKSKARAWTAAEDAIIKEHLGRISEDELASRLGRSRVAVKIHRTREMDLCSPSKSPLILTAEHVSMGLGLDGHSVHRLMDRGLMPMRRLPMGRPVRVVDRSAFVKWALDPKHWCYFRPRQIGLRRFRGKRGYTGVYDFSFWKNTRKAVRKAFKKWPDKWLTPGQATRLLAAGGRGCAVHSVNAGIRAGNLQATRWGNWWILRSALPKGKTINAKGRFVDRIHHHGKRRKKRHKEGA